MNNPMEYFRKGAEKRKADATKKSMYGDGDEVPKKVYGPKTQSESELAKLQMLRDMGLAGKQEIITPKPLNPNFTPPPPKSIPNPNFNRRQQRPTRPMSPIQKAMMEKLLSTRKNP